MTINTIFLQYIEHIDAHGFSGNLIDILVFMHAEKNRRTYKTGKLKNPEAGFVANQPIKVLMVPPEDRHKVKPALKALHDINIEFS